MTRTKHFPRARRKDTILKDIRIEPTKSLPPVKFPPVDVKALPGMIARV